MGLDWATFKEKSKKIVSVCEKWIVIKSQSYSDFEFPIMIMLPLIPESDLKFNLPLQNSVIL